MLARMPDDLRRHWTLDPAVAFLNHGSFGACPAPVLEAQSEWRARLEREPVRFLVVELEGLLDEARAAVAAFVGADADDLAFAPNATTAVNAVLRSLPLAPGDEIVVTDHAYNACRNAVDFVAARAGARVVVARVPFPLAGDDDVLEAVRAVVGPRTRLALLDHVTSPTGLVLPIERLVAELAARGVDTLVDGAHGPGMLPLDLARLGAAYYAGNLHKWCCAPKGAALLHVRRDRQDAVRPWTISHGANSPRRDRSRFRLEFDWTGTIDPTAVLCVPAALRFVGSLVPGGWSAVQARNHALTLAARDVLAAALGIAAPCPDAMIGSLAALPLPDARAAEPPRSSLYAEPLQQALVARHHIQVPVAPWPAPPRRLVRVSAHLYNDAEQYRRLAAALVEELARERDGARG
jgi:isopenicillin-N epimerase